jgi:cation transport ATPase
MAKARTIYFDKTGTLTVGKMQVLGIVAAPGLSPEQRFRHLAAARALEAGQTHPAAKAIVAFLERELGPESDRLPENGSPREGDSLGGARAVRQLPEGGIEGEVLGSRYAIRPLGLVGQPAADTATVRARYGLDCDGARVTDFEIGDEIRVGARATLGFLRARGLRLRLLSGDRDSIVRACALELGFAASEIEGEATPESKARIMRESGRASIMVGDGANDAAALAAAGVGVAVRGSLESSLRAADIYLTRSGLDGLPAVWLAARMTRSAVFRGLAFSGSFNLASGALAIAGHMSPLGAAVLMPLSSLVVLASALLTGRAIARIK